MKKVERSLYDLLIGVWSVTWDYRGKKYFRWLRFLSCFFHFQSPRRSDSYELLIGILKDQRWDRIKGESFLLSQNMVGARNYCIPFAKGTSLKPTRRVMELNRKIYICLPSNVLNFDVPDSTFLIWDCLLRGHFILYHDRSGANSVLNK